MDLGKISIDKFDGSNFASWSMQIEDYLYQKDLYLPLGEKKEKPKDMDDKKWALLDRKTLGAIRLSLMPSVAFNIADEKTTEDVMKALTQMYEKPSVSNEVFLMRCLISVSRLAEGYDLDTRIMKNSWKITKGDFVVMQGQRYETLYRVWHQRRGHENKKGRKIMASKRKHQKISADDLSPVAGGVFGKQKAMSFSKTRGTSKVGKLELVHTGENPASMLMIWKEKVKVYFNSLGLAM